MMIDSRFRPLSHRWPWASRFALAAIALAVAAPGTAAAVYVPQGLPGPAPVFSQLPSSQLPSEVETMSPAPSLETTLWRLVSYTDGAGTSRPVLPETTPTLKLEGDRMGGNGSCNQYFGRYSHSGDRLTLQPEGATMMACEPEIMAQEQAFWSALERVATYTLETATGILELQDGAGQVLLRLEVVRPLALTDTPWELMQYNNGRGGLTSAIAGTQITATVSATGQMAGSAGCNTYVTTLETTGDRIHLGPLATTRKLCAVPAGVMEQEQAYLRALAAAATYTIEGDQLTLQDGQGTVVVRFQAAGDR